MKGPILLGALVKTPQPLDPDAHSLNQTRTNVRRNAGNAINGVKQWTLRSANGLSVKCQSATGLTLVIRLSDGPEEGVPPLS